MTTTDNPIKLISPKAIATREFDIVRKNGFDPDQVRGFLEDTATSYAMLYDSNLELQKKQKALAEAVKQIGKERDAALNAEPPDFESERRAVLATAQQEADSIRAAAQSERDKLLADAAKQAAQDSESQQAQYAETMQSVDAAKKELQTLQDQAEAARHRAEQYVSTIEASRASFQNEFAEVKRRATAISDRAKADRQAAASEVAELKLELERIQTEIDETKKRAEDEVQNAVAELKAKAQAEVKAIRESAQREADRVKQDAQQKAVAIEAEAQTKINQAEQIAATMKKEAEENESRAAAAQAEASRYQMLAQSYCSILNDLVPLRDKLNEISYEPQPTSDIPESKTPRSKTYNNPTTAPAVPVQDTSMQSKKEASPKPKSAPKPVNKPQPKNTGNQLRKGKSPVLAAAFSPDPVPEVAPNLTDTALDSMQVMEAESGRATKPDASFPDEEYSFGSLLDDLGIE